MTPRRNLLRHPAPGLKRWMPGPAGWAGGLLGLGLMGSAEWTSQAWLREQTQAWFAQAQQLQAAQRQAADRAQAVQSQRDQQQRLQPLFEQLSRAQQNVLQLQEAWLQVSQHTPVRLLRLQMDETTWQWQAQAPDPAAVQQALHWLEAGTPLAWHLTELRREVSGEHVHWLVSASAKRAGSERAVFERAGPQRAAPASSTLDVTVGDTP